MIGIVDYLPQLAPGKQMGDLFVGEIQLVPGRNEVDTETWEKYANHPLIKARKAQGIVRTSFEEPTIIVPPEIKKTVRTSASVETKLAPPESTVEIADTSTFVARPPEIEKTPTPSKK